MTETPSAISEAAGLLLFFGLVGLAALLGHLGKRHLAYLRRPRWILEVRDLGDGDPWFQPASSFATRDVAHLQWAARQWRNSGYETRLINLNDFDQEV